MTAYHFIHLLTKSFGLRPSWVSFLWRYSHEGPVPFVLFVLTCFNSVNSTRTSALVLTCLTVWTFPHKNICPILDRLRQCELFPTKTSLCELFPTRTSAQFLTCFHSVNFSPQEHPLYFSSHQWNLRWVAVLWYVPTEWTVPHKNITAPSALCK